MSSGVFPRRHPAFELTSDEQKIEAREISMIGLARIPALGRHALAHEVS
jgi:hypothetical protein